MRMLSATELLMGLWPWAFLAVLIHAGCGLSATDLSVHDPVYLPPSGGDFWAFAEAKG